MRLLSALAGLIVIGGIFLAVSWFIITRDGSDATAIPITFQSQSQAKREPFDLIIVQAGDNERRILHCQRHFGCQGQVTPSSINDDPLFDGLSWYRYLNQEDPKTGRDKLVLQRVWTDNREPETIVEGTPLVRPRGLVISPDGSQIAYWLDNISEPRQQLTELWVYDSRRGSTTVVAEKLSQNDNITSPRWNRASTHLWFFNTDHELQVIPTGDTEPYVPPITLPADIDPEKILPGQIDIDQSGRKVAYVVQTQDTNVKQMSSTLTVLEPEAIGQEITLKGLIPFVKWLPDSSLIYAVQDALGTSFWRYANANHTFIARHDQIINAAHSDVDHKYIIFAAQGRQEDTLDLFALHIADQKITPAGSLTQNGTATHIVRAQHQPETENSQVAGVTTKLSDEELVAFVDKHLTAIVNISDAKATKLLITDQVNTSYVDYQTPETKGRILLTVRDAVHAEWSVRAWYREVERDWRKVEGSGLKDPETVRWYEWEEDLNQWILKSESP